MSQLLKSFMGIFLILFMIVTSLGILAAYFQVMNAQDLQARIVNEVENGDYAAPVVKNCFDYAAKNGYKLAVTYYYEDGGVVQATQKEAALSDVEMVEMARIDLSFPFRVAFFKIDKEHTFSSYAR